MLASDLNNPEFVGAVNPDDLLFVEFYMHEPEDWNKSMETGKKVRLPAIPYVRIQKPGDKTSIIETPVREDHKQRWPQKWLYFQMKEGMISDASDIPGWKIEDWDVLTPDQVRELKYLRFSVVEQIAGASDEQVQRMGMGGLGLREQARQALRNRMGQEVKEVMAAKDAELADMKERMAKLEAFIMQQAAPQPSTAAGLAASSKEGVGQGDAAERASERELLLNKPAQSPSAGAPDAGPIAGDTAAPRNDSVAERNELAQQYVQKFGKKPHHKLGVEKIKAALNG